MATKNMTSAVGHLLPVDVVIPVPGASRALHRKEWTAASVPAVIVQATTNVLNFPVTWPAGAVIRDAWAVFKTLPAVAGGTATIQIDTIAADGTTTVVVVTAVTVLSGLTAQVPFQLTLAATNPAKIVQGASVRVTFITSNNSVGTADVGFGINIVYSPIEPDPIIETA